MNFLCILFNVYVLGERSSDWLCKDTRRHIGYCRPRQNWFCSCAACQSFWLHRHLLRSLFAGWYREITRSYQGLHITGLQMHLCITNEAISQFQALLIFHPLGNINFLIYVSQNLLKHLCALCVDSAFYIYDLQSLIKKINLNHYVY